MKQFLTILAVTTLLVTAMPSTAQAAPEDHAAAMQSDAGQSFVFPGGKPGQIFGAAIGTGLIVMGAARGIGRIGGSAVESIARQPDAGGRIFTSMLLSAALIEGFTLFGIVVTLLAVL